MPCINPCQWSCRILSSSVCEFLEVELNFSCLPLFKYFTYCTICHHKQVGPLLSSRQEHDEWQVSSEPCQVTQLKIHDTEPSSTTVEHICQSGSALQNRDHTLFIRVSKMSQRRGPTFCLATMNNSRIVLLPFSFCSAIIFSSICYSHLSYGLAPWVGHSASEPGLLRPGKTRRSQTNKKAKAPTPRGSQSGSCQGDIRGTPATQSPNVSLFPFSLLLFLHLSPPFKRYVLQMTEPSPNAPKMPFFPSSISLFPPLVSLCLEPAHMDWDQFRMKW